jgi:CP family cyanate transporter-like MFS transporter
MPDPSEGASREAQGAQDERRGPRWRLVAVVAVLALSANLRPVATAVGPVLEEIRADLGLGPGVAGLLTAMPGLVFGLVAGVAVALARRLGVTRALVLAIVVLAGGLLLRTIATGSLGLLTLSALALSGAAIGNVLVPAFIKSHFPGREAGVMSGYAAALGVGAMAAVLVSAPLAHHAPGGWRAALGLWGLLALVAMVPWLGILVHERRRLGGPPARAAASGLRVWRSRQALALAAFFGVQSMQAYVQFGWAPQMFRDAGLSPTTAGSLGALIAFFGLPSGILMPLVVARVRDLRPIMIALGVLLSAGYLGILWAPTSLPWLWACCLGLSAFAFPTALALMTARTRRPVVTASVSGFTQTFGYLLAAVGPFAVGALLGLTGGWSVPLVGLALCGPLLAWTGVVAARPHMIDDDLLRS